MNRGFLFWSLVLFALVLGGFLIYLNSVMTTSTKELKNRVSSMPPLRLVGLDSTEFRITPGLNTVIIYFNSECDHCKEELKEVRIGIKLFSGIQLVLMSSQELKDIREFAGTLDLARFENVHFAKIGHDHLATIFGVLGVPQTFVYDSEGRLLEIFAGETAIEKIVSSYPQK